MWLELVDMVVERAERGPPLVEIAISGKKRARFWKIFWRLFGMATKNTKRHKKEERLAADERG